MAIDSHTLARVQVREIGRSLSINGVGITFDTDTTMAFLSHDGTCLQAREEFIMSVIGILSLKANIFYEFVGLMVWTYCQPDLYKGEFALHLIPHVYKSWVYAAKKAGT